MKPGLQSIRALGAAVFLLSGGCAVLPLKSDANIAAPAERDMLADAALAVETTPWPNRTSVSFVSRIAGAADKTRLSRSETIEIYLDELDGGGRFDTLALDARANLSAAERLNRIALNAIASQRLSMNDVAAVEGAIKALRDNRQIYVAAAKQLEKAGDPVDETQMDAIRSAYKIAIKELGQTADALADQIERDRSETYAAPERSRMNKYSGT